VERPGAFALDLQQVFRAYEVSSEKEPAANGTKVGHLHLYVGDLDKAWAFYQSLGMEPARWWPPMQVADLGGGGPFKHRVAINTWQGLGAPPSPAGSARMRHFEMRFDTPERLQAALAANPSAVENGDAYELTDPSGIKLRLAKAPTGQPDTKQVAMSETDPTQKECKRCPRTPVMCHA
jgi:catechol 2,3-dioxygenase